MKKVNKIFYTIKNDILIAVLILVVAAAIIALTYGCHLQYRNFIHNISQIETPIWFDPSKTDYTASGDQTDNEQAAETAPTARPTMNTGEDDANSTAAKSVETLCGRSADKRCRGRCYRKHANRRIQCLVDAGPFKDYASTKQICTQSDDDEKVRGAVLFHL